MLIAFELSMPSNNSWNGRWTGDAKKYVIVRCFRGKQNIERAVSILANPSYRYSFGDGWVAVIQATEVTAPEASKLRRQSDGFCGYDWMVSSICEHLEIRVPNREATTA